MLLLAYRWHAAVYPCSMKRTFFTAVLGIWTLPQTVAGTCVYLAHQRCPHYRYHGTIVTVWNHHGKGMSMGPFIFTCPEKPEKPMSSAKADPRLLVHEYGHALQSLILGPLYLPFIGLPSVVWANLPALKRARREKRLSYYSFYPEKLANWLGEHALGRPSPGQAIID